MKNSNSQRGRLAEALCGYCACLLITFAGTSAVGATTIAVVPSTAELGALADLLSVPFSQMTNIALVERSEIQRVLREQELALTQPQAVVKAGRLLNADGLLLLEKRAGATNETLSARVVAVKPGVMLVQDEFALPLSDTAAWATSYAARIVKVLPKLNVKMEDAVPVSIGSLRSSVSTSDSLGLEQELTTLLRVRLAQEPSVFVLERRDMESLEREKQIGVVDEPFWNGAFVIDGTINRDAVSATEVTIDTGVAAPGVAAIKVHVAGTRQLLPVLVNELVTNILTRIGKRGGLTAWQTEAEAEKFLQEAQWAAAWGLWSQTREAADAAWFLGKRTALTASYRIVSRGSLALKMRGYEGHGYDTTDKYGFYEVPSPRVLSAMSETLELFRECTRALSEETNAFDAGWVSFGYHLLPATARVLKPYYNNVDYRTGREADLQRLRGLARELNTWLMARDTAVGVGKSSTVLRPGRATSGFPRISYFMLRVPASSLAAAWWESEGLWFESPKQSLEVYEALLSLPAYWVARNTILGDNHGTPPPPLAGWNARDRNEVEAIWLQFLHRMAASSNLLMQADANSLILSHSNDPVELERAARAFRDIYATYPDLVVETAKTLGVGLMEWFPPAQIISNACARMERWGVPQVESVRQLQSSAPHQFGIFDPNRAYREWTNILRMVMDTNGRVTTFQYPMAKLDPKQLAELIPAFERVQKLYPNQDRTGRKMIVARALSTLRGQRPAAASSPTTNTDVPANQALSDNRARIVLSHIWRQDEQSLPAGRTFPYGWPLKHMFWKDGKLWMVAQTHGLEFQGANPKVALLQFDPKTLRPEIIETPFEQNIPPGAKIAEVANGEIFIAVPEAVWRRNAKGVWSKISVPLAGTPLLWGNSVVLSGSETIVQLMLDSGEVRILASKRRNPPVSALDTQHLFGAVLTVWPDNNLYVLIEKQVWKFDKTQKDWRVFLGATNCGESLQLEAQGILFRQSGECGGPMLFGAWRPGVSQLDYYTWERGDPIRSVMTMRSSSSSSAHGQLREAFTPPLWKVPDKSVSYNRVAQFDGTGVWLFPVLFNPYVRTPRRELSPPTLLFFDPLLEQALELQIDFANNLKEEGEAYKKASPPPAFLATPEGLAIQLAEPSVLMWASRSELQTALATARAQQNAHERLDASALNRFDRNSNRWLDDTERRTMRHDAGWQRELSARIESARSAAVKQRGAEWQRLFAMADKDRNGKLSAVEISNLVTEQPSMMAERLVGSASYSAGALIRPYDLNSDGALDVAEFTNFMTDPRLPSEVNRSATWVTNFGLTLEQCDRNDDGTLDNGERAATLRLIRQKIGPPSSRHGVIP